MKEEVSFQQVSRKAPDTQQWPHGQEGQEAHRSSRGTTHGLTDDSKGACEQTQTGPGKRESEVVVGSAPDQTILPSLDGTVRKGKAVAGAQHRSDLDPPCGGWDGKSTLTGGCCLCVHGIGHPHHL